MKFWKNENVLLVNGSSESMYKIGDKSVDLIIFSPPYNAKKIYEGYNDDRPWDEYFGMLRGIVSECHRVLKSGGRVAINVANLGRKPYFPLTDRVRDILIEKGFMLAAEIIWNKKMTKNGLAANGSTAWGSWCSPSSPFIRDSHEYFIIGKKDSDDCNIECKIVEQSENGLFHESIIIATKESYKLLEKGETDLTAEEFKEWTQSIWDIPPEMSNKDSPVPFPEELIRRLIKLYTWKGATVLDPCMGSGTTCKVAVELGRKAIGYDVSEYYYKKAKKRFLNQPLEKVIKRF